VYPLLLRDSADDRYLTMDEAIARGLLVISERGEGSVPVLVVDNRAEVPVFLLAGEIVKGGKQNRVISQDALLPARSGPIPLNVFCVEEGRWQNQTQQFAAESEMAHGALRQKMAGSAVAQRDVWTEVDRKAESVAPHTADGTKYLGRIYEDKAVSRELDEYCRPIRLPRAANGMAVVINSRVVGVELFGST